MKTEHKLLRIKITLECEIVGDDIYLSGDMQKAGEGIFRANMNDILTEARDHGLTVKVSEIKTKAELPDGYTAGTLPWLGVIYGDKTSETTIGEILNEI